MTIAAAALVGWWAGLPLLSSWISGFTPMKPVTALCLTALGLVLAHPGKSLRVTFAVGLAVAALAALDLGHDLLGVDFSVNRWLAPQATLPVHGAATFRMITGPTLALALAGGSLALNRFEGHHFASIVLGILAGVIGAYGLLGYLLGIHTLHGAASARPPALPTAVGLLCIGGAILLRLRTMPSTGKPRPLWHLLVMLGCAIIAPLLLFGFNVSVSVADTQFGQVRNNLTTKARTLSAEVDREIIGEIERLQALAASPSLRQGDFAEFQRQAEASPALRHGGKIALFDRHMQQVVNTWAPSGTPIQKAVASEPVEKALATGKPQVTGLFMGPATGHVMFSIVVPVQIDSESRYALVGSHHLYALADLVVANELPPGWLAVVSDAAHRLIARSDRQDAFVGKELPSGQWRGAGPGGVFESVNSEGRPSLEGYAWSTLTGWQASVWGPKALLEAPVRKLWWTIGLATVLAFALVIALTLWLARIIACSVGDAARAAIALGEGFPLAASGTPIAEIDTLMAELRRTAAKRRAAEDSLRASNERLQLAINAALMGWWQYEPRHRIVSWDMRAREILGIAEDRTPLDKAVKLLHPYDTERVQTALQTAPDPADPKPAIEFRVQRGSGRVRWVEVHWLSYFEDEGCEQLAASVVGIVQDITDRKEHEEKVHLLMREVNHRAKNLLSVVDAIARQTAARSPEDFIDRFSERIQALSAYQDLLVENEWNGIKIGDLVCAQLAPFADLISFRIVMHGPELYLKAASAQAIGLALHELSTNAGKYGALSTDTGRVDISWAIGGGTLTMSWTERDGPRISAPKRRGFGTVVMETMTERSLGGTVKLDCLPSGLTWRLSCPAENAVVPNEPEQISNAD
jgi:PAS domain S-box-containing protein